jgi:hypothetical protein
VRGTYDGRDVGGLVARVAGVEAGDPTVDVRLLPALHPALVRLRERMLLPDPDSIEAIHAQRELHMPPHEIFQFLEGIIEFCGGAHQECVDRTVEQSGEDLVLALEVSVDRRRGDTRTCPDRRYADAVEAALIELDLSRLKDRLVTADAPGLAAAGLSDAGLLLAAHISPSSTRIAP